jgi:DedD protein
MADQGQDTEIMLGAGKILGLFFGLVILCAIFFGAGYTVGKNAALTAQQAAAQPSTPGTIAAGETKPSPATIAQQTGRTPDCTTTDGCGQAAPADLTFYKAVEQKNPNAQLSAPEQAPEQQKAQPEVSKSASPAMETPAPGAYVVQVAAVSKQQDAEALLSALRKKQYPVFIATPGTDRLFHVQAGPFSDIKEAEYVKTRLVNDGYNPILKK